MLHAEGGHRGGGYVRGKRLDKMRVKCARRFLLAYHSLPVDRGSEQNRSTKEVARSAGLLGFLR